MITPSENGISGDGSQYYGSAEYYSEKNDLGEVQAVAHAPMQWVGSGAELLGLPHEIRTEADLKVFDDLIKGKLPDGREMPAVASNGKERRTGEDFVASAPKSVSIMATYGGDERILEAWNRAVLKTVDKIQQEMMAVRGMVDGKQERVDGEFIVALAQHLDARPVNGFTAADLHTHMLFMNVAIRSSDSELRAVSWEREKDWQKAMNAPLLAELAHELRELGYDTYKTKDAFEIAGISREMIEDFSPRFKAINQELEKMGLTRATATAEQKQAAAFKTREDKEHVTHEQMLAQGNKLAAEKGYDFQSVKAAALLNERHETHEQRMDFAAAALLSAARHLSERHSVFEAKEVMKHSLAVGLPKGITETEIKQAWIERKDKHGLLTAKAPIDPKTGAQSTERWVTTSLAVARDEKMIKNLRAGKGAIAVKDRWTKEEIQKAISTYEAQKGFKLSSDQVAAIHTTLESGDRNTVWQGVAGAGKTTALEVVKIAAENRGYKVLGIASGTQAVKELTSIGVECKTHASWISAGQKGGPDTFFFGDEHGMTASEEGAKIVDSIQQNKSRGLFVGDDNQLQAVGSGSPFRIMKKECDSAILTEIRRQKTPEMLNIAELFSQGKASEAATAMEQFMVAVDIGDAADFKDIDQKIADAVAKEYLALPQGTPTENDKGVPSQTRDNTLLLVATNSMRERLNEGIRAGLKAEGTLGAADVQARTLHDGKATKEELRQAYYYDGKMKDADGKAVQIVIIPEKGYAVHGAKFADAALQKHHLQTRAEMSKQGEEAKKNMPVILEKGLEYRVQSVDLQKGEVHLLDKENREILWKPDEAGKVKSYEEKQTAMAVNDKVIFKQNQDIEQPDGKEMKVFNGQKGVVTGIDESKIYIKTSQGEAVAIDKNGGVRVEHAYSGTVHSMQGATADYGIAALRSGSQINTGNQGYVGQTRFRYEIKVHTDSVAQLQKDWSKGYQYQQNAIDYAHGKDQQKFNQQVEEKKMEIVEKEDMDPKMEPEKGSAASVNSEREAPDGDGALREAEPDRDTHETAAPSEKEVTDQPEKDAERDTHEAPAPREAELTDNPHGWYDDRGRSVASQEEIQKWEAEHPEAAERYHHTPDQHAQAQAIDPEKGAEHATESAMAVWDESVPAAMDEQEYAESAPEPEHRQGMQERMDDAMDGHHPTPQPGYKAEMHDWAAHAEMEKMVAEREWEVRANFGWYEPRGPREGEPRPEGMDESERKLAAVRKTTYEEIHARMEEDRAIDPNAHPDPYLASSQKEPEPTKEPEGQVQGQEQKGDQPKPEKGQAEAAPDRVQQQPENQSPPMPPMDRLEKWVETQRPERAEDAGRDAQNWDTVLGHEAAQKLRYDPTQQNQQQDKGMEREI